MGVLHAYAAGTIFGEPVGEPPFTLLALHGWGRDHHDFDQLFRSELNPTMSALGLDLPGFGATPAPPESWGSEDYARSLAGVLELMDDRPIILGHSFGGRVALKLARLFPDRIGGLVLTGVPLVATAGARSPFGYRVVRSLARHSLISEERLDRARRRYGSNDYNNASGVMREILVRVVNERYEEDIDQVVVHVEMLWGAQDRETPVEGAVVAERRFKDAHLEVLEHLGHLIPIEAPAPLAAAVARTLS